MNNDDDISTPVGLLTLTTLLVLLVLGVWKLIDLAAIFIAAGKAPAAPADGRP